ncbi:Mov34/MPN/PAD-1 family protein [Pontibacter actiniarum]|uniref:Mov34/MPN/PAD-1 family protein n=1 Tax=Pontibacter actiniarum TaxID=323450 RepID=UPI00146FBB0D|nr:Mov34/MPN/PAD-1 family protein [Pontibacter actiniarum]
MVWLRESAYNAVLVEAIKAMPRETGGVLIGYWGNLYEAVVTDVIGPGSLAVHKRHSFVPDNTHHVREIEKAYLKSDRTETYLGDWHTHPKSGAYLSERDQSTLLKIANYKEARLTKPLMMVLGTKPFGIEAWINAYASSGKRETKKCTLKIYQA